MGKDAGEEQQQPPDGAGGGSGGGGGGGGGSGRRCCCGGTRVVRLQCVAALVLGIAVLLSAVFWLPPFAGRGRGAQGPDPGDDFGDDIMASFRLQKTVPELSGNKSKLELDIYEEIGFPNSTVVVKMLHPLDGSNWTNVIFSIVPFPENLTIPSTWLSILRSYFMSLVVRQSTLHLTEALFGNSSSFEVVKFPGGITIIPPQTAFLLQKPHATFNFTLNYPINKIQDRTNELKDQMKAGLLLNPYENLYIKLTNSQGSTILPPTIVDTSIVLKVGNHQPSVPRMKQLARTITNSSSRNLGLNHTVFGRVKQISLSSYLRHSLHSGGGSDAPSPAPMHHHVHHRHHRHHHGNDDNRHLAPAPIHFPVPQPRYGAPPPSGCPYGTNRPKKRGPVTPAAEPAADDHHSLSPAPPPHPWSPSPVSRSPHDHGMHSGSPVQSPPVLPEPPLPAVSFAHAHPPSEHRTSPAPSEHATRAGRAGMSYVAPAPHSSNATRMRNASCRWVLFAFTVCALMRLL
ncbi:uncharacterized protein LOC133909568 [Phragmites australis]|uniref:uncharacterized protein LOC133909568 n=1 Tax=Phragmites australis TaxID=29695 RepID=UPI002D767B5F|nr:uncharacterized protein LOC133909568 [Phragmites australis]